MRQLIRTYSITGLHLITITGYTFTKQDIRLILDETLASNATTDAELLASVLVSSTKKGNVVSVLNGVITLDSSTAILTNGDDLTIEIDIDNGAKESTSQTILSLVTTSVTKSEATANKQAVLDALTAAKTALQGNDNTATLTAIESAISALNNPTVQEILNGLAKQGADSTKSITTLDADLGDVAAALEYMEQGGMPQIAQIAKQGTNANANISEIQSKIGTPATGQPSDLFAAIAAGGGGGDAQESTSQEILSRIGSAGSGQSATLFGAVGDIALSATTLQSLADSWAAMVTNREIMEGYVFSDEVLSFGEALSAARNNKLIEIDDDITENYAVEPLFSSTNLVKVRYSNIRNAISFGNIFYATNTIQEVEFPNVTSVKFSSSTLRTVSSLRHVNFHSASSLISLGSLTFSSCPNLIDIELGSVTHSFSLDGWSPTNALMDNSQTLLSQDDLDAGFTSNLQKLLYNIREHIAANLPVAQNTITFSANIKAAIQAETGQATAAAFTNKGWTIA